MDKWSRFNPNKFNPNSLNNNKLFFADSTPEQLKNLGICHLHFTKESYIQPITTRQLHSHALPELNLTDLGFIEPSAFCDLPDDNGKPMDTTQTTITNERISSKTLDSADEPADTLEPNVPDGPRDVSASNNLLGPTVTSQQNNTSNPSHRVNMNMESNSDGGRCKHCTQLFNITALDIVKLILLIILEIIIFFILKFLFL